MTPEILSAIDRLTARGYGAANGLRAIAEKAEDTWLNDVATKYYQDGPREVAIVVEMMIAAGKIIPAETDLWWPSRMEAFELLDLRRHPAVGNPPRLSNSNAVTGVSASVKVAAPTQEAVDAAIAALALEMQARGKRSAARSRAEREVDAE